MNARFNIVDAALVAFLVVLVPLGYGTYLLFRPAQPHIDSVAPSEITVAERRIGNGAALTAKFKIRGSGLTPLLRARIGDSDALGLVFESPNSADVLVGPMPPGKHDLVLLDGVHEVARATGAIEIQASTGEPIKTAGWLVDMDRTAAAAVVPGRRRRGGACRPIAAAVRLGGYRRPGEWARRSGSAAGAQVRFTAAIRSLQRQRTNHRRHCAADAVAAGLVPIRAA
jgi:hypothetical protein